MRNSIRIKPFKTKYRIPYILLVITPFVDTINGLYIQKMGATGISLGTFYRIALLLYGIYGICKYKNLMLGFLPLMYFPFIGCIKGLFGEGLSSCLTYAAKWVLPLVLILFYGLAHKDKCDIRNCLVRCLDVWSIFVPASLIIEFALGIGKNTYYNAGFKGLYYSTNDIALVLTVLFIYSLYKVFMKPATPKIVICVVNLIAIIVLSTKSCLIFAAVSILYFAVKSKIFKKKYIVWFGMSFLLALFIVLTRMQGQISNILLRYTAMWNNVKGENLFNSFMLFATSGRTGRIDSFFNQINNSGNVVLNFLFGWIQPDNAHVIEMDWHDSLCQYGFVGFLICFFEYGFLLIKSNKKVQPYFYAIIICFIYSLLAGHVINGALSGTIFSVIFSLLLIDSKQKVIEIL